MVLVSFNTSITAAWQSLSYTLRRTQERIILLPTPVWAVTLSSHLLEDEQFWGRQLQ